MTVTIRHLYPDLMSLYGSWANVAMLTRLLTRAGFTVNVDRVPLGAPVDTHADLLYMGAGTERARDAALRALYPQREAYIRAAENGTPMLFVGTALEVLGSHVIHIDGTRTEGLGVAPFTTVEQSRRIVGDVLGDSALSKDVVVGYMNKCTHLVGVDTPLLTACRLGFGNDRIGGAEGYHAHRVFGSELTGPLLVKNPSVLCAVAEAICCHRNADIPAWEIDRAALDGYAVTVQELRKRIDK